MNRLLNFIFSIVIIGAALNASSQVHANNASGTLEWQFKVYLDKKEIGTHDYRVIVNENIRRVETEAAFDVKFLFINAYSYRHKTVERWDAQCLTAIDAKTDANGKKTVVNGNAEPDAFIVDTGTEKTTLPGCVMSFAYWHPEFLNASKLLNAQTGEYDAVNISDAQKESITFNGKTVDTNRYDVAVQDKIISVWYAADDMRWLALEAPAKGDRLLRYEAVEIPPADQFVQLVLDSANADAD